MLWPGFLILLGLIPLLIAFYLWILRRRRRFALRYSSLALLRDAIPRQSNWKRHIPFALFLLAITGLIIAASRPVSVIEVPAGKSTIILAMDVSMSMCSSDIPPSRLDAAKEAALSYIQRQQASSQIGVVAFAGFAAVVQSPTSSQAELRSAIQGLTTGRWTAIGSGILESIDAIAEMDQSIAPSVPIDESSSDNSPVTPASSYVPNIIVVLTDGVSNQGPIPQAAARQAVERGIRVFTIGFGTNNNDSIPNCGGMQMFRSNDQFGNQFGGGGGGFGGSRFDRGIDEETLMEVADMTGGEYYAASSADQLQEVFHSLPMQLTTREETTEISIIFTAAAALLAIAAILLAVLWSPLTM
jgi:Ca-activated chloride channel family protein